MLIFHVLSHRHTCRFMLVTRRFLVWTSNIPCWLLHRRWLTWNWHELTFHLLDTHESINLLFPSTHHLNCISHLNADAHRLCSFSQPSLRDDMSVNSVYTQCRELSSSNELCTMTAWRLKLLEHAMTSHSPPSPASSFTALTYNILRTSD